VLALPENEVHVYYLKSDTAADGEAWLRLLSPEERERYGRYLFEKDRRIFLLAHALARLVLALYTGSEPEDLEFDVNEYGKPSVRAQAGKPCPGFNLSHTHGMVALAVAQEQDIGVDVEDTRRSADWLGLTGKVFTPAEQADLWSLAPDDRKQRFYELWTLKEAYIKARGMGLSLPLEGFSMRMPRNAPVGIEFGAAIEDDADQWQFELFTIAAFRLAVAVRTRSGQRRTVRLLARETGLAL